ncbi:transmembrane and immunoglobulin domain-containing protein 2 [Ammospiza caudacuta]|uniref:transmembrane and immunoglobulin domain-containing protein 2 n=1 Tax=Ammospiza caudacuta TaxID=2857398 RepID=UPI00273938AA|nr:transmembrane and immunoglobulin domain-containing protein 2 [Ammospiza caudacuta]
MWQLGVLIPLLGAGALRVAQEPAELQVAAGDAVALQCQVEVAEGEVLLRMEWLRDGGLGALCATRLRLGTPLSSLLCAPRGAQLAWHPPRATLSLPQVQSSDSGRYLCRVTLEIPRHDTATGNGTELRVSPGTARDRGDSGDSRGTGERLSEDISQGVTLAVLAALLWALLAGLGSLGGTVLLLGLALLGQRCCHRSPGAVHPDSPIYLNVGSPSARGPPKPPPPQPEISPYQVEPQRARGPPLPPRP